MPHLSGCLKLAFDSRPGMIFLRRRLSGMLRHAAVASGLFIFPWSNTFISCQIHSLSGSPTVNQTAYHLSRINYVLNVPFDEVILCGFSMYSCSIPLAHLCMLLVSAGVLAPDGMYYHNEIDTPISSQ